MGEEFDLELCDDKFKNHVVTRCQDKSNPMTLAEYQILKTKLIVIEHIKSNALNHLSPSTWTKILTDVNHPNSLLGPNYVKNLQHFFQENSIPIIDEEKLKSITSFAKGA